MGHVDSESQIAKSALRFVVFIGVTSLFADFTYEAARSINGQYLAVLGASATVLCAALIEHDRTIWRRPA